MIVIIGLMLLLQNMGLVRINDLWAYWPAALIVIGIARLSEAHGPSSVIFGALVTAVGALLLLRNLDILRIDFSLIWPLILIAFGLSMLWRTVEGRSLRANPDLPVPAGDLHLYAVFGGIKRRVEANDFRGGDVLAVFGGIELDLRGSAMPAGQTVIEINAVFGGVEMTIPDTWVVDSRLISLFAGVEDRTLANQSTPAGQAPRLVLTGYTMFAGVTIRN